MATASVSPRPRRRPASRRLIRAALLLVLAAVVAVASLVVALVTGTGSGWPVAAGLLVLALGAAATRLTHREVLVARRDGGADRARLAKEYRVLAATRIAEQGDFAAEMGRRVEDREREIAAHRETVRDHEATLERREKRLAVVEAELDEALQRLLGTEADARRHAARADEVAARLRAVEGSAVADATHAAAVIAELESERDALRSELQLWQRAGTRRQA